MTPTDETPAQSYARVAAASEAREQAEPPAPSAEVTALRALDGALAHLQHVGRYASHLATCQKDASPEAVLAGRVIACSCDLDPALESAAAFVHAARKILG